MRILITNDDGINAPGLKTLQKIAETLAGAAGEMWTVAPSTERSGVAHAISLSSPVLISQLGPRSFSIDGYPADCVLAGLHHILKGSPPDIVLSGVNRGNNSAENALYSGTLGAAIEGALQGVPSFALSQYLGPNNVNINDPFEASATYQTTKVYSEQMTRFLDRFSPQQRPFACKKPKQGSAPQKMYTPQFSSLLTQNDTVGLTDSSAH